MQLHTLIYGTGMPLLCLHGHPGKSTSMSVFTQHLAQRFTTLAPDLRGYGQSQTGQPFAMADHLTDLAELLEQHQVGQFVLLGWSLGGILALELALRYPDRVRGLILIASAARPWGNHPPVSWQDNLYTGIASMANRIHPGWQWNIDTFGKRSLYRYLVQQHTPATYGYLAREAMPAFLQTSRQATRALSQALRQGYNRLNDVEQIQCPCLVLAGAGDRHITAAASQETAQRLPNAEYHCYPDVAHLFPWEIPERVLGDIDRWCDRWGESWTRPLDPGKCLS
jgi:pimeloyl-ACP methyl ester carboxylesterase